MIVCVCNALSEDEVRGAVREGAACPNAAYAKLGCEAQCGTCLCYAQEIIDDELRRCAAPPAASNVVRLRTAA
jgi:bacterioferritin-associated ferredoxin